MKRLVEQNAGGSDKRMAGEILFIARFFAHYDDPRRCLAFAKHGLRRMAVEIAAMALLNGFGQLRGTRAGGTYRSAPGNF